MEWLKELLGEELYKSVMEKLGETKLLVDDNSYVKKDDPNYIPRSVLNEQKNKFEKLIEERDKDLIDLKDKVGKGEGAAEKLSDMMIKHEAATTQFKEDLKTAKINAQVEIELIKALAIHPDLLKSKIDPTKVIEISDGVFSGIAEQIKLLKEGVYKDQFGRIELDGAGDPDFTGTKTKPKIKIGELQKQYDEICTKFGQSSAQAIHLKNEMFAEETKSTATSTPEKT